MEENLISTKKTADITIHKAAIIAGIGLLIMVILAPFGNFYAIQRLVVLQDAAKTASNIIASQNLFRIGICCLLINAILDVVVAWALYIVLKPVNKSLSLLGAWFRIVYATILVVALNNLLNVIQLLNGADYQKAFETDQVNAQVMLSINAFNAGWNLGMVIFGLHLLIIGYLAFISRYIPKFLGILIIIAGLGYLIDSIGKILLPNYNLTISMVTFIGEVLLIFWLLIKGRKIKVSN
jgi:hypothetical protein